MKQGYVPRPMAEFLVWHTRFKNKLVEVGASLGVGATDIEQVGDHHTDLEAAIAASEAADAVAQQKTIDMNQSRRLAENLARRIAQSIKKHKDYSPAVGELLGIEGPEDSTSLEDAKPEISAFLRPGGLVEVKFVKGKSHGVNLYSQREGETGFGYLARDTVSPYVDNRPLLVANKPETRRYKAVYVVNDAEVGVESDIVEVVVKP